MGRYGEQWRTNNENDEQGTKSADFADMAAMLWRKVVIKFDNYQIW